MIDVESARGRTVFRVSIPDALAAAAPASAS